MNQKRIVVLSRKEGSGLSLKKQLEKLFGNIFDVDCFSLEKGINSFILADLVISNSYQVTGEFVKYLAPGTDIYVVRSTLTREAWEKIVNIPLRSKILVVANDFDETVMTIAMLYELGARHLDLIPYYPGKELEADIKTAITLNEEELVPKRIEKIINIGDRVLDSYTLYDILGKLGKINKTTTQIIVSHMGEIIPRSPGLISMLNNIVESKQHLELSVNVVEEGIIAYNHENKIIIFNKYAEKLFNINSWDVIGFDIEEFFNRRGLQKISSKREIKEEIINYNGSLYILNKHELVAKDEIIGGVVTFKESNEIQRLELKFRQNVRKKGHYSRYTFKDIIGNSRRITETKEMANRFAKAETSILIQGESGTGKELFAQAIHNASNRKGKTFVAFNCAAVTESLIESELFGYEEGAFTGARKGGKPGLFEIADKGTIFLDEIGDIPLNMQARLLRVLQEKEVIRVGGTIVIPVDIRIIAATNQDLWGMVQQGKFRNDLYYRLNVLCIKLPRLSERKEDIPYLIEHMLDKRGIRKDIPNEVMQTLQRYDWPGNIRELENCVEYLINVYNNVFRLEDLPVWILNTKKDNKSIRQLEELGNKDELINILKALKKRRNQNAGMGRRNLHQILFEQDIDLTEHEIRSRLKTLANAGLVIIQQGRGGTKLSSKGEELLNNI